MPNNTTKPCNGGCGASIKFDETRKSKSGKFIPLNLDGSFHICPNKQGATKAAPAADMTPLLEELKGIKAILERISGQLANK